MLFLKKPKVLVSVLDRKEWGKSIKEISKLGRRKVRERED
jgi:hypothetical protein